MSSELERLYKAIEDEVRTGSSADIIDAMTEYITALEKENKALWDAVQPAKEYVTSKMYTTQLGSTQGAAHWVHLAVRDAKNSPW